MSNQQAQQQQQRQQQQQPEAWKPDSFTKFLVLSDDKFEPRARAYLKLKYGAAARAVVTEIDKNKLSDRHTIVVLYYDPDPNRLVKDEESGKMRPRFPGKRKNGRWEEMPEPPEVLESKPINCAPFYLEGADNDGEVRLKQSYEELPTGAIRWQDGLLAAIAKACHPAKPVYREDAGTFSIRGQ
jgi:hypothetical protein